MKEEDLSITGIILFVIGLTIFIFMGASYSTPRILSYFKGKKYSPQETTPDQQLGQKRLITTFSIIGIISIIVGFLLLRNAYKM